ncbi:hypothetical protein CUU54_17150 [Pectobacterium polaris]|uniref:hypothetical protein n=1 Tax=Pectobacterium polaris TaxID=2042057 RepID=UPI000D6170C0|nr:hypothetical protein [Pectobacterium polaris]MCU1790566.1 hypothetical protein [Pectobacterium polaris]PWD58429.1 hypothetical protein DF209_13500 [Pectobacterium polaris]
MNIIDVFFYKLENFINPRCYKKDFPPYYYKEDERDLYLVSVKKENGRLHSLTRWYDIFPKGKVDKIIRSMGFSENDCYAIKIILSRFGYLFQIDNRQRMNKDIHVLFYVFQLTFLKLNKENDGDINYFFKFLCFELGIDDDVYDRFYVYKNKLFLKSEKLGDIDFYKYIIEFYDKIGNIKNKETIVNIKSFQLSVIDFLLSEKYKTPLPPINDINKELISPDFFLLSYNKSKKIIFDSLIDCFNKYQSNENLFISNSILMNYSYYILKNNNKKILSLKRYVGDDAIFSSIISSIAFRGIIVNEKNFIKMGLAEYLNLPDRDETILYNLIYSR